MHKLRWSIAGGFRGSPLMYLDMTKKRIKIFRKDDVKKASAPGEDLLDNSFSGGLL